MRWGRSKYGATRTEYGGRWYASRAEASYAAGLDMRLKAKDIRSWEPQVSVNLEVNGIKICRYVVDFRVQHLDGSIEWVEVKGFWTPEAKLKAKLFDALYLHGKKHETYTVSGPSRGGRRL